MSVEVGHRDDVAVVDRERCRDRSRAEIEQDAVDPDLVAHVAIDGIEQRAGEDGRVEVLRGRGHDLAHDVQVAAVDLAGEHARLEVLHAVAVDARSTD